MRRPYRPLLLFSALAACAPMSRTVVTSQAAVEMIAGRGSYRPGETVSLGLRNRSPATWSYNACSRTLQRETAGAWTVVAEPERACTRELSILAPGASATATVMLPADLPEGTYRVGVPLAAQDAGASGRTTAFSQSLRIAP